MGHHSCCNQQKVKRGLWSPEEDGKLIRYITTHGYGCWSEVPEKAGLQRCGKSCRLRWINYLRPDIRRGRFSPEEEKLIISLHRVVGNRWAHIASHLPGRTDNEIKNYWNSWIKKKLKKPSLSITPQTNTTVSADAATTERNILQTQTSPLFSFSNTNNQIDILNNNQDFIAKPIQFRENPFPFPVNNPFFLFETNGSLDGVNGDQVAFWEQELNTTSFSMGMDSTGYNLPPPPPLMENIMAPNISVEEGQMMSRENHVSEWGPSSYLFWDVGEELADVQTTSSNFGGVISSSLFPSSI